MIPEEMMRWTWAFRVIGEEGTEKHLRGCSVARLGQAGGRQSGGREARGGGGGRERSEA